MKKNTTSFVLKPFKNRNGITSFRVSGWLHGERIRKNFKSREEAAAEKSVLEIKAAQAASGLRPTATILTPEQQSEAEALFLKIKDQSQSLSFFVEFALANYRPPNRQQELSKAIVDYEMSRKNDQERSLISMRQLNSITRELKNLNLSFSGEQVSQLDSARLVTYLERGKASLKTYSNRRGILSTFFKFAFQKDWIATNPIEKTPHHKIFRRRGSATTITAAQAAALMAHVEEFKGGVLVPYFAICLFGGVRPCMLSGEIIKLKKESIRLDTGVIHIEPEVSKVRMKRHVTIQPNLAAWICAYPVDEFPIMPTNAVKMRRKIFKKFGLTHDVLRHTFISMHVAKFRSMGEAALQAGNSESIIRKHYLDLKTAAEADVFFGIVPKLRAVPVPATPAQNAMSATPQHELMRCAA